MKSLYTFEHAPYCVGQEAAIAYLTRRVIVYCPFPLGSAEAHCWGEGLDDELRDHDEVVHAYASH